MSDDYNSDSYDDYEDSEYEELYRIDIEELKKFATRVTSKAIVASIFSLLVVRPLVKDLTGKKLRKAPLIFGTHILWGPFVEKPLLELIELRREEAIRKETEEGLRDIASHLSGDSDGY